MADQSELREANSAAIKKALGGYFLLGMALAFFAPQDLSFVPALSSFFSGSDDLIPGIPRLARLSPIPDVLRVFLIVMWVILPVATYRIGKSWSFNDRIFLMRRTDQWFVVVVAWFLALLAFGFLFFFLDLTPAQIGFTEGRGAMLVRLLTQGRLSIGIAGSFYFCALATLLGIAIRFNYLVISKHTRSTDHTRG